jgi:hypothetical protein
VKPLATSMDSIGDRPVARGSHLTVHTVHNWKYMRSSGCALARGRHHRAVASCSPQTLPETAVGRRRGPVENEPTSRVEGSDRPRMARFLS